MDLIFCETGVSICMQTSADQQTGFVIEVTLNDNSGLVLVSTGVWKLEKPSVAGHYDKSSTLKLNADENLAYAA